MANVMDYDNHGLVHIRGKRKEHEMRRKDGEDNVEMRAQLPLIVHVSKIFNQNN